MFLQPATAVVMLIWFSGFGLLAGVNTWTFLRTGRGAQPGLLSPVAMLIFGAVLVGGGFFPEALKARRLLEQLLATPANSHEPS